MGAALKKMRCLGVHLPWLKAPSIIPQLQHSDMFLIFHADKLPETHFLCFYHVGLTTVKLKVSCYHALMLKFGLSFSFFFFWIVGGYFRSSPSMSVNVGRRNYAARLSVSLFASRSLFSSLMWPEQRSHEACHMTEASFQLWPHKAANTRQKGQQRKC